MIVVRDGDDDRVDVFALLEHLAVVFVLRDLGILFESFRGPQIVDVAQRDDVFGRAAADIVPGFAPASD